MLRLVIGRAGAGKTALILREIKEAVEKKRLGSVLLVPEQYSHEAERELAREAGDAMSLYAEVLSFTGLARKVEAELGCARRPLSPGGRLLCMALALDSAAPRLKLYSSAARSPEQMLALLGAVDELHCANLGSGELLDAAAVLGGSLGVKLGDLALIMDALDGTIVSHGAESADRLTLLAERLEKSAFGRAGHIYIDGFTDFTAQESGIIRSLMGRGASMTVCLTADSLDGDDEVFELSRRTARSLLRFAEDAGVESEIITLLPEEESPIDALAAGVFAPEAEGLDAHGAILLRRAASVTDECELAASRAIELAKSGERWRDIAVAVRGFETYREPLEAAFRYYGVPLFTARSVPVSEKPLPTLISSAYDVILGGWNIGDLMSYLRTGLALLDDDECDELENYALTWSLKAWHWLSDKPWRLHPDGYDGVWDDSARERLERINALRDRAAAPLLRLREASAGAKTAEAQARALSGFFDDLSLSESLARRADELDALGRTQAADEYARLWDAAVTALEDVCDILGDTPMDASAFSRLYSLTLSQCGVGVIPVSLDMVTAGDMDRMRRRHIKHLIVLGASDDRLPAPPAQGGVFTPEEREALGEAGLALDALDAELWREYTLIYNTLSLPSETLMLVSPAFGSDGKPARVSYPMLRAERLFGLESEFADLRRSRSLAPLPALELACDRTPAADGYGASARAYYNMNEPERLAELTRRAGVPRGRLSRSTALRLYGKDLRLSPSRIDSFSSCRFRFFLQYGLKAKPRASGELTSLEFGSFMHYILMAVSKAAKAGGGIKKLSDPELDDLTRDSAERYFAEKLGSFEGRGARFEYLFRRLTDSACEIVRDMAEELRNSDFEPLSFELDFAPLGLAAHTLPDGGRLTVTGIADRVDGWVHGGRLYLRVVDYKTGRKSFSLSDVWYGMGMQMLIYLFALAESGEELYGMETESAGVMYIPARSRIISSNTDLDDEEISKKKRDGVRRSGLFLGDASVLHAMERGDAPRRIPVKWKDGVPSGECLASAEQLGRLSRRVEDTLLEIGGSIRAGSISADPYYKDAKDLACLSCDYADACRFCDGEGDDELRVLKKLPASRVWNAIEKEETT